MGRILGAAVVPSAPLVLPAVAASVPSAHADDVAALRAAAHAATAGLPDVTSRTQFAQRHGDDLEIDLAVLGLQLPAGTPVLPVAVAPAEGPSLAAIGRAIVAAVRDSDVDVTILFAGDLSAARDASSPRYLVEGATEWDRVSAEAVAATDVERLVAQSDDADRVHARSWAPLVVGLAAARAAGLTDVAVRHLVVRGVGHVVGRFQRP